MKIWRIGLILAALLLASLAAGQKNDQAEVQLKAAMHRELVDGDLKGAIDQYQKILASFGSNRTVAAQALVQMGQCYEKLGKTEARNAYERVLREFADQSAPARLARQRLAALKQPTSPTGSPEMAVRRVWAGPGVDISGAPSRDGAYLTFKDWPSEDLAIRDLASGQNRRLTNHRGDLEFVYNSVPSPDGKQVAYSWYNADSFCDLRIVGLDGSEPRILYRNPEVKWLYPVDWSGDGKYVLAIFPGKEGNQVVLVSAVDRSVRVLKTFAWDREGRPRFSPDGRHIAYDAPQRPGAGEHDIFLLALDTGGETPLIQHPSDDVVLDWTPDGKGILFLSDRSGTMSAWLIQVADGKPQGIPELVKPDLGPNFRPMGFTRKGSYYYSVSTSSSDVYIAELDLATGKVLAPPVLATQRFVGSNDKPDWSPDGRRLIFLSHLGPTGGWALRALCVRSTESGEVRDLASKLNRINWARWFPDGRSLLAGGNPSPSEMGLYRIDVQTGEFSRVSDMSLGWSAVPSRSGKTIFRYRWNKVAKRTSIMELALDTGQERELHSTDAPSLYQSSLALSPDGQQLAFVVADGESQSKTLKVMPAAGGEARDLLRGVQLPHLSPMAWTADGLALLFVRQPSPGNSKTELWLVPVQGGEPRKLDLTADGMRHLCVHPDGRHIAFTAGRGKSEVWVMENLLPASRASR